MHAAQNGARGQVEGVAYSSARIEVRQNGVMIYTTLVPGGPFTLKALPLLSNQLDLEVSVHEQDGQTRRFRVPAASLQAGQFDTPSGFSLAAGTVRRLGTDPREAPAFATLASDWNWGQTRRMTGGVLAGTDYLSMGWGLRQQWPGEIALDLRHLMSRDKLAGLAGEQIQLSVGALLAPNLSANVVAVRQSQGYRTLSDTGWNHDLYQPESRSREYWVYSLNGSMEGWGAVAATWSRYSHQQEPTLTRAGLSWSAALSPRTNLALSLERDIGNTATEQRGSAMYLTVNMALDGQRRVRSYLRNDERSGLRKGLSMSDVVSDTLAYTFSAEHRDATPAAFGARLSALPHYTSLDAGIDQRNAATEFDLGLRGGVAFHREGVTLSPYPLRDTFAVLKAGNRSGLKLQTPQGPVWTDGQGYAVAASLPVYSTARVEVDPTSLPRNVETVDGYQEVEAGRGSVQYLDFSLVTVRRLLLTAIMADQQRVPQGLTVHDGQGEYLTTVLEGGRIFLADVKPGQTLHVQLSATSRCVLDFTLAAIPDDTALIENVDATCTPLNLS
jgi:outer membrane usher protein FimD/PapC